METEKDRIEKVMETEGLNASQFAAEIGIKGPTLSHILNGRNNPSLEVLKRVSNRYTTINPEWLIFGVGSMYRGVKQSQALSLFDTEDNMISKSDTYIAKKTEKTIPEESHIRRKTDQPVTETFFTEPILPPPVKKVKKIIVYYEDNSFQEFESK